MRKITFLVTLIALSSILCAKEVKTAHMETFIIKAKKVAVHKNDSVKSKIIKVLKKGEKVEVKYCNKFGWCKLEKGGFVAKYLLKK